MTRHRHVYTFGNFSLHNAKLHVWITSDVSRVEHVIYSLMFCRHRFSTIGFLYAVVTSAKLSFGGWMDGWMGGWVGGWVDGWVGGWVGGGEWVE